MEHALNSSAVDALESGSASLSQVARFAGISIEELLEQLARHRVAVVSYDSEDLEYELDVLQARWSMPCGTEVE